MKGSWQNPLSVIRRALREARAKWQLTVALVLIAFAGAALGIPYGKTGFAVLAAVNLMSIIVHLAESHDDNEMVIGSLWFMLILTVSIGIVAGLHHLFPNLTLQFQIVVAGAGLFAGFLLLRLANPVMCGPSFEEYKDKWITLSTLVGLAAGFVALAWVAPKDATDIAARVTFIMAFIGAVFYGAVSAGIQLGGKIRPADASV